MKGKWRATNERRVYDNEWVQLSLYDVELPDGTTIEHHIARSGRGAVAVLVHDPERGVLMLWRHRFADDRWGWELPAGRIDGKETPEQSALREVREETGWQPGKLTPLATVQPISGWVDFPCHLYATTGAQWEGPAADPNEAADMAWVKPTELRKMLEKGEIGDGVTAVAVLWAFTFGIL